MIVGSTNSIMFLKQQSRIDASFHLSEGQTSLRKLEQYKNSLTTIGNVCTDIFIGGRSKRIYVSNPTSGIPFLSSSDMLMASLDSVKLISKQHTSNLDKMLLKYGWTLISRSGTIGNTAFCRKDMENLAGSEHIMRLVPDESKILPGYLFAYASSSIGNPIIKQGTFGTVIDTIEPEYISNIPIPILPKPLMQEIHNLVEEAAQLRTEANSEFKMLQTYISNILNIGDIHNFDSLVHRTSVTSISIKKVVDRLGALFYSDWKLKVFSKCKTRFETLGSVTKKIFAPPMFKHIYLEKDNGYPFIVGGELQQFNGGLTSCKFLSPLGVKNINDYIVKEGWTLIYRHGQLNSMLGTSFYVDSALDEVCLSDLIIRLVPDKEVIVPGYLAAILRHPIYTAMLKITATGNMIPYLAEKNVEKILIPVINKEEQLKISENLLNSHKNRRLAFKKENQAIALVEKALQ